MAFVAWVLVGCEQKSPDLESPVDASLRLEPPMPVCGAVPARRDSSDPPPPARVNEVFAGTLGDETIDWIEIHNASDEPVALGGWRLEDYFTGDLPKEAPGRYEFPPGTTICPRKFLVLGRNDRCDEAPLTFDFGVGSSDRLVLSDSRGRVVDDASWADLPAEQSIGRADNDDGELVRLDMPTQGEPNTDSCACCGECKVGRCTEEAGMCVITSSLDCATSAACTQLGWCAWVDGTCQAGQADHCTTSLLCREKGLCAMRGGRCVLGDDADCEASKQCENEGRCFAGATVCEARSEDDCLESDDCVHINDKGTVLSRKNRCSLDADRRRCVATSCEGSSVCQERGCCALLGGKCVAP